MRLATGCTGALSATDLMRFESRRGELWRSPSAVPEFMRPGQIDAVLTQAPGVGKDFDGMWELSKGCRLSRRRVGPCAVWQLRPPDARLKSSAGRGFGS